MATSNEFCNIHIINAIKALNRINNRLEEIRPVIGEDRDPIRRQRQVDEIIRITNNIITLEAKIETLYIKNYLMILHTSDDRY